MREIVRVNLENEMDLILAHKRAMKMCELTGFSLIVQTSFATAVSEIARCAIGYGKHSILSLGIESAHNKKFLKVVISDEVDFTPRCSEAYSYAKRLVDDIEISVTPKKAQVALTHQLHFAGTLTDAKIDSLVDYFKNEQPISAYDELRRKNLLLQEFAEKLKSSENDYRVLTDSLPVMMFAANIRGQVSYSNKWLNLFLGSVPKELHAAAWQAFLPAQEYSAFGKELSYAFTHQVPFDGQYRFKEKATGNFAWHRISVIPLKNDKEKVTQWIGFIVDINAEKQIEQTLKYNRELQEIQQQLYINQAEMQQKVLELNRSNYELEQFAHLASHDLQEPLRKLFFYSDVLKKRYTNVIDVSGLSLINNMTLAATRMKELISDLLTYSQLQKQDLSFEPVELNTIIEEVMKDLDLAIKEKSAVVEIDNLPLVNGNTMRLRQLFSNLISNSLKYSKADVAPLIQITLASENGHCIIKVKDNGIGFEEQHREKIFGLFERLHTRNEFPGTGIGLSICKKIVELHHGSIKADAKPNEYAIFEITLPTTTHDLQQN